MNRLWALYTGCETLVAYGVCANETLEVLDLRCNKICEVAGKSIARILTDNATLRSINLEENKLACNGAEAVAAALPSSTSIVELDLRCNSIGDRGLCALAAGVRNMEVKPAAGHTPMNTYHAHIYTTRP